MNVLVFLGQAMEDAKKFGWEFSPEGNKEKLQLRHFMHSFSINYCYTK